MPPGPEIYIVDRVATRKEGYHEETDHGTDQTNLHRIGNIDFDTAVVDREMTNKITFREKSVIAPGLEMTHLKEDHRMDHDREITPTRRIGMKPMHGIDPDHEIYLRKGVTGEEERMIWRDGLNRETGQSETKKMKDG